MASPFSDDLPKVTPEVQERLRGWVREQPDLTLEELRKRLAQQVRLPISVSRLWTVLAEWACDLKTVAPRRRARHRCGPAPVQPNGAETSQIDPARLIFLDESGVTTEMTWRYRRAPRGERVGEGTLAGHWRTLTIVGANRSWVATMTIEAATDGEIFLA